MKKAWIIPLAAFALIVAFLAVGLRLKPQELPSALIGKPAPPFVLPRVDDAAKTFAPAEMRGKVWVLNVWASWCAPCRAEHPVLLEFARKARVPIVGLNYTDKAEDSRKWLAEMGDPYVASALDADGRVGIDYGVYGVPETYVVDRQGVIRYKHVGPLTRAVIDQTLLPLIRELDHA
ncbi:MAG: DsbE family thiol:disulfide interchange protein [Gammaproteobacteria bacterium]